MSKLIDWLESGEYLPERMRDFHDQKAVFKHIHTVYQDQAGSKVPGWPVWVVGHQYVIDWFLWYMASRGYTLQKTRKQGIEFNDWPKHSDSVLSNFIKENI